MKLLPQSDFAEVISLIQGARFRALKAVNTELINLYWSLGEYISRKVQKEGWGKAVVQGLAEYIREHEPGSKGFSAQNLWQMKQFYDTYRDNEKLSALLRELPWTHNLIILSKSRSDEEREF
jgi:predicted nuclease of restriction endonuclease-like (RecB) superfamily